MQQMYVLCGAVREAIRKADTIPTAEALSLSQLLYEYLEDAVGSSERLGCFELAQDAPMIEKDISLSALEKE